MQKEFSPQSMAKMAMCIALISVSSYIAFPLPFTPAMITASTAAMGLAALVLTPKQTFITMSAYLILGGLVGLPILPGGIGGLGRLLGPTGGFYFAWVVAYTLVSMFKGERINFKRYLIVTLAFSLTIVYIGGIASMMMVLDIGLEAAVVQAMLPFIPGDIFKGIIAAFVAVKVNKALPNT
ncbi:MAG: biotin transporter BioY [Selenomonadaceae bacterium]|nr:biotin transporter BioY [Selenomonadaceae bacterium]